MSRIIQASRCAVALFWCLQDVLEEWLTCQRSWLYLEPIFSSDDINQQLPVEGKRYQQMEQTWRRVMKSAFNKRKVSASTLQLDVKDKGFVLAQTRAQWDDDPLVFAVKCMFQLFSPGDWAVFRRSSSGQTERVQCAPGTGAEGSQWVLGDKTRVLPQVSLAESAPLLLFYLGEPMTLKANKQLSVWGLCPQIISTPNYDLLLITQT